MRRGFSVVEVVVVLGVLGILFSIGPVLMRPPAARVFANDVASAIRQARFEAIKRDVAIAVVWDAQTRRLETRLTDEVTASCGTGASLLRSHDALVYGNVTLATDLGGNGLLWFPNGMTRACDGTLAVGALTIRDARATFSVSITPTGKVEVQ
jgi:prepilin-type N-terminal cleavage/methylation domain-containing protein